tara:strand:+ start:99374 stop:99589 length:216 start_codon:yes stop_codon:yes gene_type:complete
MILMVLFYYNYRRIIGTQDILVTTNINLGQGILNYFIVEPNITALNVIKYYQKKPIGKIIYYHLERDLLEL